MERNQERKRAGFLMDNSQIQKVTQTLGCEAKVIKKEEWLECEIRIEKMSIDTGL